MFPVENLLQVFLSGVMLIFPIVKSKFGLADATDLQIFDETNTAVDEDILLS